MNWSNLFSVVILSQVAKSVTFDFSGTVFIMDKLHYNAIIFHNFGIEMTGKHSVL
jgi:hypothetical protein